MERGLGAVGIVAEGAVLGHRFVDVAAGELFLSHLVAGEAEILAPGVEQALVFRDMGGMAGVAVPGLDRIVHVFMLDHLAVMAAETEIGHGLALQMVFEIGLMGFVAGNTLALFHREMGVRSAFEHVGVFRVAAKTELFVFPAQKVFVGGAVGGVALHTVAVGKRSMFVWLVAEIGVAFAVHAADLLGDGAEIAGGVAVAAGAAAADLLLGVEIETGGAGGRGAVFGDPVHGAADGAGALSDADGVFSRGQGDDLAEGPVPGGWCKGLPRTVGTRDFDGEGGGVVAPGDDPEAIDSDRDRLPWKDQVQGPGR